MLWQVISHQITTVFVFDHHDHALRCLQIDWMTIVDQPRPVRWNAFHLNLCDFIWFDFVNWCEEKLREQSQFAWELLHYTNQCNSYGLAAFNWLSEEISGRRLLNLKYFDDQFWIFWVFLSDWIEWMVNLMSHTRKWCFKFK